MKILIALMVSALSFGLFATPYAFKEYHPYSADRSNSDGGTKGNGTP